MDRLGMFHPTMPVGHVSKGGEEPVSIARISATSGKEQACAEASLIVIF